MYSTYSPAGEQGEQMDVKEEEEKHFLSVLPTLPTITFPTAAASDIPALISPSPSLSLSPSSPTLYSLLTVASDDPALPHHVPARYDWVPACAGVFEYDCLNPPPADWLIDHRSLPTVFRNTFASTVFWSAEQQTALKDCFTGWSSDPNHPFLGLSGDLVPSATWQPPAKQQSKMQCHTLQYYLDRLALRRSKTIGLIIYNVKVQNFRATQLFRFGPAVCNFYRYDLYQSSPDDTELTLIAGMKNTWTPVHIDDVGDSTWSMAIEGHKLWIFARPEHTAVFTTYFNRAFSWNQLKPDDRQFLISHKCLMIYQRPGDIIYVPCGWPHMVKHLTDTLCMNSSLLNGWDAVRALGAMDFGKWTRDEWTMFTGAYERAMLRPSALGLTAADTAKLTQVWNEKREEAEEVRSQRRRLK